MRLVRRLIFSYTLHAGINILRISYVYVVRYDAIQIESNNMIRLELPRDMGYEMDH